MSDGRRSLNIAGGVRQAISAGRGEPPGQASSGNRPPFGASGSGGVQPFRPGSPSRSTGWTGPGAATILGVPPGPRTEIRPYTSGRRGRSAAAYLANSAPALYRATTLEEARAAITQDQRSQNLFIDAARQYYAGNPSYIDSWALGTFADNVLDASKVTRLNPGAIASMIASGELAVGAGANDTDAGGSGRIFGGGGGGGGGSSTQMSIDISTPTGARALLTQAMQSLLGRDPSAEEISTFTTALNESQQASPTVVTAAGDTVTRTGGFEADVFAADFVRNQEEFQEVQGTMYYRGLIDALTGGGI